MTTEGRCIFVLELALPMASWAECICTLSRWANETVNFKTYHFWDSTFIHSALHIKSGTSGCAFSFGWVLNDGKLGTKAFVLKNGRRKRLCWAVWPLRIYHGQIIWWSLLNQRSRDGCTLGLGGMLYHSSDQEKPFATAFIVIIKEGKPNLGGIHTNDHKTTYGWSKRNRD